MDRVEGQEPRELMAGCDDWNRRPVATRGLPLAVAGRLASFRSTSAQHTRSLSRYHARISSRLHDRPRSPTYSAFLFHALAH